MQQSLRNRKENEESKKDNPALGKVIERNIRKIINLRTQAAKKRKLQNRIADAITSFSGQVVFVYMHIIWFEACSLLNTKRFGVPAAEIHRLQAIELGKR